MTPPAESRPFNKSTGAARSRDVRALVVWLLVQLAALIVILARLPLYRGGGHDGDALAIMVISQVIMAALLLAEVMPSIRAAGFVASSAIPFVQLAAVISATPVRQTFLAISGVLAWLVALALWSDVSRTRFARGIVSATAAAVSAGAVVLLYIRHDFAAPARWSFPALTLALAVLLSGIVGKITRQVIHKNSTR